MGRWAPIGVVREGAKMGTRSSNTVGRISLEMGEMKV